MSTTLFQRNKKLSPSGLSNRISPRNNLRWNTKTAFVTISVQNRSSDLKTNWWIRLHWLNQPQENQDWAVAKLSLHGKLMKQTCLVFLPTKRNTAGNKFSLAPSARTPPRTASKMMLLKNLRICSMKLLREPLASGTTRILTSKFLKNSCPKRMKMFS